VTIVQYNQVDNGPSLQLTNGAGGAFTLSAVGGMQPVRITLFDPSDSDNSLDVLGELRFSAAGTAGAAVLGDLAFQDLAGGAFSLTTLSDVSFLGRTGTNILSGSFTNGVLSGQIRGLSPTFSVSVPMSELEGTSDFFSPDEFFLTNFSLGMSDANRPLRIGANGRIADFNASSVGTFGAIVSDGTPGAVPEPSTWAMMILGFGMVGASMRRRRRLVRTSA
jgi:hypothetical protein